MDDIFVFQKEVVYPTNLPVLFSITNPFKKSDYRNLFFCIAFIFKYITVFCVKVLYKQQFTIMIKLLTYLPVSRPVKPL